MLDLKTLKAAKKEISARDSLTDSNFSRIYAEALDSLEAFLTKKEPDIRVLRKAADKLSEALELKKNKAEPYFYLACIFFLIGDFNLAGRYLKIAAYITPGLNGIYVLSRELSRTNNISRKIIEPVPETNSVPDSVSRKSVISRPERLSSPKKISN